MKYPSSTQMLTKYEKSRKHRKTNGLITYMTHAESADLSKQQLSVVHVHRRVMTEAAVLSIHADALLLRSSISRKYVFVYMRVLHTSRLAGTAGYSDFFLGWKETNKEGGDGYKVLYRLEYTKWRNSFRNNQ